MDAGVSSCQEVSLVLKEAERTNGHRSDHRSSPTENSGPLKLAAVLELGALQRRAIQALP